MKKSELQQIIREEIDKILTDESFDSMDSMSEWMERAGYPPLNGYTNKELPIIKKHIKSDILDKGKKLTPRLLNSLLSKLDQKYRWIR